MIDSNSDMIVGFSESETEFTPKLVFDELANMMLNPESPMKPEDILVAQTDLGLFREMSSLLPCKEAGSDSSRVIFHVIHDMVWKMGRTRPAIDFVDGVTDEDVARYYAATARFFKQLPWRLVQGDRVIGLHRLDDPNRAWGVSVIGQTGEALGISVVAGEENGIDLTMGAVDPDDLDLISIQYGEDFEMVPTDLLLMESRSREIAGSDAYPLSIKLTPGIDGLDNSDRDELQMVTTLLNELPAFLRENAESSVAAEVATFAGTKYSMRFIN